MAKYGATLPGQRDATFTPGEHFFECNVCGISPSNDPRRKGIQNYRLGGRVIRSRGTVARLTHKDGRLEDKTYAAMPKDLQVVDFGTSDNPDFGPQALGKFTKAIMDSLHLTATGAASPVREALLAGMRQQFSDKHFSEATARFSKRTLRDDWDENKSDAENASAWVDIEQYFAGGQGKNLVLKCIAKPHITQKGLEIVKTYFEGVDQAEWYALNDAGELVFKEA